MVKSNTAARALEKCTLEFVLWRDASSTNLRAQHQTRCPGDFRPEIWVNVVSNCACLGVCVLRCWTKIEQRSHTCMDHHSTYSHEKKKLRWDRYLLWHLIQGVLRGRRQSVKCVNGVYVGSRLIYRSQFSKNATLSGTVASSSPRTNNYTHETHHTHTHIPFIYRHLQSVSPRHLKEMASSVAQNLDVCVCAAFCPVRVIYE